ncbi:MAG: radical SAM protein [Hydrogenophilus sp.]|nr:radical SAM protein [Hydrogenophilus sp.]
MNNLTLLWNRVHPHLTPLLLPPSSAHLCPSCSQPAAAAVLVQLHLAAGESCTTILLQCTHCRTILLPPPDHPIIPSLAAIPSHLNPDLSPFTPPHRLTHAIPTALEARLWSAIPAFTNLEPTNRCNLRCLYCIGRHLPPADLTLDRYTRILDNLPGIRTLALVGEGEPLLNKTFWAMAEEAHTRGIAVVTVSNGTTWSRANIERLCRGHIRYIAISIDAVDPAQFARSRPGGHLPRILANIRRLRRYRDQHARPYPKIGLKGTLFYATRHQLLPIVRLAHEVGVELLESFQPLNPKSTYAAIYPPEWQSELAFIDQVAAAIAADLPQAHRLLPPVDRWAAAEQIPIPLPGRRHPLLPNCDETGLYLLADGTLTPCCQIKTSPDPLRWNLVHRPWSQLSLDPLYQRWRYSLLNGLFPSHCHGCYKTRAYP